MSTKYEMELWEDKKRFDDEGKLVHHPLNSLYLSQVPNSYGTITFSGWKLAESHLLQDVKVFHLHFYSDSRDPWDYSREIWANPIRVMILNSLTSENLSWYLTVLGEVKDEKDDTRWVYITDLIKEEYLDSKSLGYTTIKSEMYGRKKNTFFDRFFFETPESLIDGIVTTYWPRSVPGHTIQGFLMPGESINQLNKWNNRERDDELFDEVMDFADICFYTFPAENQHMVFLTRKYSLEEFSAKIEFRKLEQLVETY